MKILISDQDRDVLVQAMLRECLLLGFPVHDHGLRLENRLADAALTALTRSPEIERVYAVGGQWSRPESSVAGG